jgi:hypothetical protein
VKPLSGWNGSRSSEIGGLGRVALLGALTVTMVWFGGVHSGALEAGPCRAWRVVPAPPLLGSSLDSVAGTSPREVWAVGSYFGPEPPVIIHWDGTAWTQFPQQRDDYILNGVDALSPNDAWAVGYYAGIRPLALHWDGTSWEQTPNPVPGSYHYVQDVEAIALDDVWAVGHYVGPQGLQGLALHWDGASWSAVPPVPLRYGSGLYGVTAASSNDVWAVGFRARPELGNHEPLIEHWDGIRWSVVEAAPPPSGDNRQLFEVAAISSDDIWAVGFYASPDPAQPLIEHWDGTKWSLAEVPYLEDGNDLFGVDAISPDNVWAVGKTFTIASRPLTMHWDGTAWTKVRAPSPSDNAGLSAVTAVSSRDIWAVGSYFDYENGASRPLTEHSRGMCR